MPTTLEHSPIETHEESSSDVCVALFDLNENCRSQVDYYRKALHVLAVHFGSPYAAIRINHAASTLDERVRSETDDSTIWEAAVEEAILDCHTEGVPLTRMYEIKGTSFQAAVLAVPVCETPGCPIGAMAVIVGSDNELFTKACLGEFAALVALTTSLTLPTGTSPSRDAGDDSALKRAMVKSSDFQSLHEMAFAITNSLKNKFSCERVTLGQVDNGRIRILSISGLDNVYSKSPGVQHIRQAMEECLDQGSVICFQDEEKWSDESVSTNHYLHRRWHAEIGSGSVASVPLIVGQECVAVLSMSRSRQLPFSNDELIQIEQVVTPFAPALLLVAKADRGLVRHFVDTIKSGLSWLLAPRSYQRKVIASAVIASIVYFCFASIGYEITVPSQITPTEVHVFASPYEGTIKACYVEVGDDVAKGELLYQMDTTDLQLEHDRLEADLEVLRLRVNQAMATEDVRAAALAAAESRVILAQIEIARRNLAKANVVAPFQGTVVTGKLSQRIGEVVPLGTPLLEFVPKGSWSIELLVPEAMTTEIEVGYEGQFACIARPGESIKCTITRIRPSPEPRDGKNVFITEATVESNPTWMRSGMEGTAQIDAGSRRVWWVALHRVIDFAHQTFWL